MVKRHLKSLIAGLFNIVLHLQSPFIFYRKLIHNKGQTDPDPGSVILMCIEVLTRISGKHALFQMDPCHLQQCLRIPAALFQSFRGLRLSDAPASYNFFMFSDNQDNGSLESMDSCTVDRQFTIDLFAACCILLNTVLKHHKRYTWPLYTLIWVPKCYGSFILSAGHNSYFFIILLFYF